MTTDYERGYNSGFVAANRGQSYRPHQQRPKNPLMEVVGYGLTAGQISVIKTQVSRFGLSYQEIAEHYRTLHHCIKQVVESKQFSDIKPLDKL